MSSPNYIKRFAGFEYDNSFVQICPYLVSNNVLNADGWRGDKEFSSLEDLARQTGWSQFQMDDFVKKLRKMIS